MRAKSLSFRLLAAEGLVLAAFFVLVAVFLAQGFRASAVQALLVRLQFFVCWVFTALFSKPKKKLVWRSPSAIGLDVIAPPEFSSGNSAFVFEHDRYVLHY